jgi:hypothetical protein
MTTTVVEEVGMAVAKELGHIIHVIFLEGGNDDNDGNIDGEIPAQRLSTLKYSKSCIQRRKKASRLQSKTEGWRGKRGFYQGVQGQSYQVRKAGLS